MSETRKSNAVPPGVSSETSKTIVRNCQSMPSVLKETEMLEFEDSSSSDDLEGASTCKESKFVASQPPRLCSSIRLARSMKTTSEEKCKQLKASQIKPKNLRKINVPFEEKLFKGLVDLKVTEEDIGLPPVAPLGLKPKEIAKPKEPEPVLSDFFKPDFSKEYVVRPNPPEFEINSEYFFAGDQVWKAIKSCQPDSSKLF